MNEHGERASIADNTRIVLRPVGSPLPVGLLSVGVAVLLLSCLQIGAIPEGETATVGLTILAFAVPTQLIAAVFCFLARDTVAATALTIFAGAWLAQSLSLLSAPPGSTTTTLGIFGLAVAAAFGVVIGGAAFGKAGPAAVILVGAVRFALTGLHELTGSGALQTASGIVGLVLAAVAAYTALATEVEDVQGRRALPLGRRKAAARALDAGFHEQLDRIEHEAGVRQQL